MLRTAILFGSVVGVVLILLKLSEYSLFTQSMPVEIFYAVIGAAFLGLGIFLGTRSRRPARGPSTDEVNIPDPKQIEALGLSPREMEVLVHLAEGKTNQQIAEELFVSTNTIKTHVSNLYVKLDVKNRTTAVTRAREFRLLP